MVKKEIKGERKVVEGNSCIVDDQEETRYYTQ